MHRLSREADRGQEENEELRSENHHEDKNFNNSGKQRTDKETRLGETLTALKTERRCKGPFGRHCIACNLTVWIAV